MAVDEEMEGSLVEGNRMLGRTSRRLRETGRRRVR